MPKYVVAFTKLGSDNVRQLVEALADATTPGRLKLHDAFVANVAAVPLDTAQRFVIRRVTGSATGTSLTPRPVDPADRAALFDAEHLITADHSSFNTTPTEVMRRPVNGRASLRWTAAPGCEIVTPATASEGLSLGLSDQSTSLFEGELVIEE